jgi:hypothetical protein
MKGRIRAPPPARGLQAASSSKWPSAKRLIYSFANVEAA